MSKQIQFTLGLLIAFLMFSGISHGFLINKYLFKGESAANVLVNNINISGKSYNLYILNESWILLTDGENVITNESEIESIIMEYLIDKYSPTEEEIEEIKNLTLIINESRNNGDKFEGFEENTCKNILGERYHKPKNWEEIYNNDIYYFYATATCSKMGKVIGCANPEQIYDDVKGFFVASEENDENIEEILSTAEKLRDGEGLLENLNKIEEKVENIEDNAEILEESKYRVPIEGVSECPDCFGICPPVLYNHTAIDELKDLIDDLKDRAEPLESSSEEIEKLVNETKRRVAYKEGKDLDKIYRKEVERLMEEFESKKDLINSSVEKIIDNETSEGFEELLEMYEDFNNTLENYNYTNISNKTQYFETKLNEVYEKAQENLEKYNEVARIKNKIEAYIYVMEQSGYTEAADYKDEKEKIDVLFTKGVSLNSLNDFKEEYSDLLKRVEESKNNAKIDVVLGDYARKLFAPVANGIIVSMDALNVKDESVLNNLPLITGITTGFGIFSIAVLIASILYTIKPVIFGIDLHKHNIKFLYFGTIGFIAFIGLIIGMLSYFPISTGITNAPIDQIMNEIISGNKVWIVIDKSDVNGLDARYSCAEEMKKLLEEKGKSVKILDLIDGENCIDKETKEEISNCLMRKESEIIMKNGETNEVRGSDVGFIRMYIKGNQEHFEECIEASLIE